MKVIELFKPGREYTTSEVKQILKNNNRKRACLYKNIYGWSFYWTTEPTFATPVGQSRKYIRKYIHV